MHALFCPSPDVVAQISSEIIAFFQPTPFAAIRPASEVLPVFLSKPFGCGTDKFDLVKIAFLCGYLKAVKGQYHAICVSVFLCHICLVCPQTFKWTSGNQQMGFVLENLFKE